MSLSAAARPAIRSSAGPLSAESAETSVGVTTCSGDGQARWAAAPWAPRPGAGSASSRCGARPWPRPRPACPGALPLPRQRPWPAFFKCLALLERCRVRVARPRLLHRPANRLERLPAALGQDLREPEFARHPTRHLRARPQPTIGRRLTQASLKLVQQVRLQNGGARSVPATQIAQSLRTPSVVAGQETLTW